MRSQEAFHTKIQVFRAVKAGLYILDITEIVNLNAHCKESILSADRIMIYFLPSLTHSYMYTQLEFTLHYKQDARPIDILKFRGLEDMNKVSSFRAYDEEESKF